MTDHEAAVLVYLIVVNVLIYLNLWVYHLPENHTGDERERDKLRPGVGLLQAVFFALLVGFWWWTAALMGFGSGEALSAALAYVAAGASWGLVRWVTYSIRANLYWRGCHPAYMSGMERQMLLSWVVNWPSNMLLTVVALSGMGLTALLSLVVWVYLWVVGCVTALVFRCRR